MDSISHRRRVTFLAAASALAVSLAGTAAAVASSSASAPTSPNTDSTGASQSGIDSASAIVQLSRAPLATSARTKPGKGRTIDFSSSAVRAERATLAADRKAFATWLRTHAPSAKVTGQYDVALNAVAVRLNGTPLSVLRSAPGVTSVGYESLYSPATDDSTDPDLALIKAMAGWTEAGGSAHAGEGVKVGIIDTGIDVTHPCFSDAGYPAARQLGNREFTNNKVIVAKVFANKAANLGYTAEAVQEHGTHVAGTVACNFQTPASVNSASIPYAPSGVAPKALLGNYNVFPGDITNARSEDILNALQAAAQDGMQVMNMSLGGGAHGVQDLLTKAVDNLDRANYVVAVAAGNSGPGHDTVESPGSAERALTAGASSVGHFVGLPISSGGKLVTVAATGDFATPKTDLTAPLSKAGSDPSALGLGCTSADFGVATKDTIALISRGSCSFGTKIMNAQNAGAVAVIVVNHVPGDPTAMGGDGVNHPTIPAVMAGNAAKAYLMALVGQSVTIGAESTYFRTHNDNIMASFSSQGPTDVDFRVKPDVVAPGVNVLSSIPHQYCDSATATTPGCWAFFQGTSMATPHLAGMAAVVRGAHPSWSAAQVRSAIVNTAQVGVLTKYDQITTLATDVQVIGSGLADLDAAVGAQVALSSVSTSFGAVPAGSGQTLSKQLTLTNLGASALDELKLVTGSTEFTVSPHVVELAPGASTTVTVTFTADRGATPGGHQATLQIGDVAHSALYAFIK